MEKEMTMVERCAKAIDAVIHHEDDTDPDCTLRYARAVIEEMREPTPEMKMKGSIIKNAHKNPATRSRFAYGVPDIYTAMIDAALQEEEK